MSIPSMGLTPLEGLVMGTRSGDIDPAIMEFIAKKERSGYRQVYERSEQEIRCTWVSPVYPVTSVIWSRAWKRETRDAQYALEVFCYRVAKYIGAYAAAMNGVDAIAFTAGIGENASRWYVREFCDHLGYLGC